MSIESETLELEAEIQRFLSPSQSDMAAKLGIQIIGQGLQPGRNASWVSYERRDVQLSSRRCFSLWAIALPAV
jgi:hypothetical protein